MTQTPVHVPEKPIKRHIPVKVKYYHKAILELGENLGSKAVNIY